MVKDNESMLHSPRKTNKISFPTVIQSTYLDLWTPPCSTPDKSGRLAAVFQDSCYCCVRDIIPIIMSILRLWGWLSSAVIWMTNPAGYWGLTLEDWSNPECSFWNCCQWLRHASKWPVHNTNKKLICQHCPDTQPQPTPQALLCSQ